jgi:hypothetical protein
MSKNILDGIVIIHDKIIDPASLIFTEKVREYCNYPYPGHPNGCPAKCSARLIPARFCEEWVKNKHDLFILSWAELDFKAYKKRRRRANEHLSDNQVKCVLYWQGAVKKILKDHVFSTYPDHDVFGTGAGFGTSMQSMEAHGILVYAALVKNKIKFEKKPKNKVILVALVMHKKNQNVMF